MLAYFLRLSWILASLSSVLGGECNPFARSFISLSTLSFTVSNPVRLYAGENASRFNESCGVSILSIFSSNPPLGMVVVT